MTTNEIIQLIIIIYVSIQVALIFMQTGFLIRKSKFLFRIVQAQELYNKIVDDTNEHPNEEFFQKLIKEMKPKIYSLKSLLWFSNFFIQINMRNLFFFMGNNLENLKEGYENSKLEGDNKPQTSANWVYKPTRRDLNKYSKSFVDKYDLSSVESANKILEDPSVDEREKEMIRELMETIQLIDKTKKIEEEEIKLRELEMEPVKKKINIIFLIAAILFCVQIFFPNPEIGSIIRFILVTIAILGSIIVSFIAMFKSGDYKLTFFIMYRTAGLVFLDFGVNYLNLHHSI